MTVREFTDAILNKACGSERISPTCDRLMIGSYDAVVRGVVTTFIVTPNVIRETVRRGANLIVTHEPTWFTGADETEWCHEDEIYLAKRKLLEDAGISVWRFHDHMHFSGTDLIYEGLLEELGWTKYRSECKASKQIQALLGALGDDMVKWTYDIPETTLGALTEFVKRRLRMPHIRFIGRADMPCSRIGILVGGSSLGLGTEEMPMLYMRQADIHVLLCGDTLEWTLPSYVHDAAQLGTQRAALMVGHERTEEAGMKYLARWLLPIAYGINVAFVDACEPYQYA